MYFPPPHPKPWNLAAIWFAVLYRFDYCRTGRRISKFHSLRRQLFWPWWSTWGERRSWRRSPEYTARWSWWCESNRPCCGRLPCTMNSWLISPAQGKASSRKRTKNSGTLKQWFSTGGGASPQGGSQEISRRTRALTRPKTWKIRSINFTNKYICFCSLFKVRGALETKDNHGSEAWWKKD